MKHSLQTLIPERRGESQPLANPPSANLARLAIRLWSPGRRELSWTLELPFIHLISDLIRASEGTPREETGSILVAHFAHSSQAFRTAKRIQWALIDFSQHRPQLCLGAALLIYEASDLPTESSAASLRTVDGILKHAKPPQILTATGAGERLRSLPGLQMRDFTLPSRLSDWRGSVHEVMWTTPSNLERAQEIFQSAQSLGHIEAEIATPQPTVDFAAVGEKRGAQATLLHTVPLAPRDAAEADPDSTVSLLEEEPAKSGSGALWWSLAVVGMAVIVALVMLLPRLRTKAAATPENPPPVVQSNPVSQPEVDHTEPPVAQKQPTSPVDSPKPPISVDQEPKPATPVEPPPPAHRQPKAVAEVDGFTKKEIPRLIDMGQRDAGQGRYDEARRAFNVVLQLDPGNAEAKLGLRKIEISEREAP